MLAKLEEKISKFKKKQDPRYVGVFMFSVFGAIVLIAMNFANVYGREKQSTTDTYNRAMYEVITSVNNVDTLVAKVRITMSHEYNIVTLSEITTEAKSEEAPAAEEAAPVAEAAVEEAPVVEEAPAEEAKAEEAPAEEAEEKTEE